VCKLLYYARRRLQVKSLMRPKNDTWEAMDRQLQIDEYTGGIDALTGGYFSQKIKAALWINESPERAY